MLSAGSAAYFFDADKVVAAAVLGQILLRGTRVFPTTRRPEGVDGTGAESIFVVAQERAGIRKFAAFATTVAFPPPA
jgi:hypothetical protein